MFAGLTMLILFITLSSCFAFSDENITLNDDESSLSDFDEIISDDSIQDDAAISHSDDDKISSINVNNTLNVPEDSELNISTNYSVSAFDDGFRIDFTIYTSPSIDGNLTVLFNGIGFPVKLVNGTANFKSQKVYSNTYKTDILYSGSSHYKNSSNTINAVVKSTKINRLNSFVYYYYNNDMGNDSEKGISQIKVTDVDGKPIKNGIVTITFRNTWNYNLYSLKVKTNTNGIAKFTKAYKPGTYTVTARHNNKVSKLGNLVLKSVVSFSKLTTIKKSAKTTNVKIILKGTGPINGKIVVVNFMKKNYRVKTDSSGVALFKLTKSMVEKLGVGKTYKIRATYRMDSVAYSIKIEK